MEYPRRALIVERLLAAALLAAALAAAWAERGSSLAASLRESKPWLAWVETRERGRVEPPSLSLAVYEPARRRLKLVHVPGTLKLDGRRTLERAYLEALKATRDPDDAARAAEDLAEARLREISPEPLPEISARLVVETAPIAPEDEPAVETAQELKARGRRPRTWLTLIRRAELDPLLFALELRRVPFDDIEPSRLPVDDQAAAFLGRLLASDERSDDGRPTIVEILNGAGAPGLASRAAKILRSRGVDVLTTGSAGLRARTLVYDRVGDFARAKRVRAALGCPAARAVARMDPSRAVDVSVELGGDCAGTFRVGPGDVREP